MIPFQFEPYNAYQKPARKKHWMEIAEEEALFHRMLMEAQRVEQQNADAQHAASVAAAAAGAGGVPPYDFFRSNEEVASFTFSPSTGGGPLSVSFSNTTRTPYDDTFFWDFGNGTTSTDINPVAVFDTGSWTVVLQATSSTGVASSTSDTVTVTAPIVSFSFTRSPITGSAPFTASFTNSTTTNGDGPITYKWLYGDGTTSALATPPTHVYQTGSFTITLQATASYNIASSSTLAITGAVPVITVAVTPSATSGPAPLNVTFSNATTKTGTGGTLTYAWTLGSGSLTSTLASPSASYLSSSTGGNVYTARLNVTESNYNIATSSIFTITVTP